MKIFTWVVAAVLSLSAVTCTKKKDPLNTLRWALKAKVKGLDPAHAGDLYSDQEVRHGFEGLLQYHYLKRPYQLIPNLAEAMPDLAADKVTYTFKIKKGVLFHDDPSFKATN